MVIAICSGSGGAGKTAIVAALSSILTQYGKRVLAVDLCAGNRGLDIYLGLESGVVYDLGDALANAAYLKRAIIVDSEDNGKLRPDFIAAPFEHMDIDIVALEELLDKLNEYDVIILDTPIELQATVSLVADAIYVVTTPDALSVRLAEACLARLRQTQKDAPRIIINKIIPAFVHMDAHMQPAVVSQLLDAFVAGVVPRDDNMEYAMAIGKAYERPQGSEGFEAIEALARRVMGEPAPKRFVVTRQNMFHAAHVKEER